MGTITVWARAMQVGDVVFVGGQAYRVVAVREELSISSSSEFWQFDAVSLNNENEFVVFSMLGTTHVRVIRGLSL